MLRQHLPVAFREAKTHDLMAAAVDKRIKFLDDSLIIKCDRDHIHIKKKIMTRILVVDESLK